MLLRELFLLSVTLLKVTHCSSDFYKKLKDGASITPLNIQEETDKENKYKSIKYSSQIENYKTHFATQNECDVSFWKKIRLHILCKFFRGIMYCTILCTKDKNCIGAKADGGSCYLYKDGLAAFEIDESSKISTGIWLRS